MNTNAIGPNGPSDEELLAGVRRRMAAVESLVPLPRAWDGAGVRVGSAVRAGVRSRVGFAGLVPLVLVAVLVVVAIGNGMAGRPAGGSSASASPQGQTVMTYELETPNGVAPTSADLQAAVTILSARLGATGITGVSVFAVEPRSIEVTFPASSNMEQIRALVGQTGNIEFVWLPPAQYGTSTEAGSKAVPVRGAAIDPALPAQFSGADLDAAQIKVVPDVAMEGDWAVQFGFKDPAAGEFETWTAAHVHEFFAIVLDGVVQAVPSVANVATGGSGYVSAGYTRAHADAIATVLEYGALPYPLRLVSIESSVAVLSAGPAGSAGAQASFPAIAAPSIRTPTDIPSSGRTLGNADAPVTIDLYGDFQCTACRSFMEDIEARLIDNYVRQGKLKIVYHDFIVIDSMNGGHDSEDAADAARIAADQGKFWVFSDYLWANQQNEQTGEFSRDRLIEIARLSGLDAAKFTADLDAGKYLADVRAESATGHPAGITGTPTIMVNGTQVGDVGTIPNYTTISAAIDRSLASSSPSATASPAPNASPSAAPSPLESASPTGSASPSTVALPTASASPVASLLPAASGSPAASPWLTPDASAFGPAEIASPTASS